MEASTDHLNVFSKSNAIDELINIPSHWKLTPVMGKTPSYGKDWQNTDISIDYIESSLEKGASTGYGLITGVRSGGLMAIDLDGQSAIAKSSDLFGELPKTVAWTSNRPGRYQLLYQVPVEYQALVQNKKILTGVKGEDGKPEQIELRYTGQQCVLPPSKHPDTGGIYQWINSPIDTKVAELPQVVIEYWLELINPVPREQPVKPLKKQTQRSSEAIPLENCLAKSNRAVLGGVPDGCRHNTAIALARDLVGVVNYMESIGREYSGDARSIFDNFCDGCSPPLSGKPGENHPDTLWESATRSTPEPGCRQEGVDNILATWDSMNGHRFEVKSDDDDLDRAAVDRKLDVIGTDFPLSKLFPSSIATPLAEYCQGTAVPQGLMSMALITCLATLVHPKTHLKCFGNTLRIAKPIFWLCIYGVSGNGKTHSYAPVLNALKKLGEEHNLLHEQALEEWNEIQRQAKRGKAKDIDPQILEQANQPPPDRQRYWVGDVTIEALLSRCAKQKERGLLMYSPELLGWCLRMNPEKGELEHHLSLWDGDAVEGERIGREFPPVSNPSISVMGGVQPDVMAKLVAKGEEIQNGFMPRMALVRFEEVPKPPLSKGSPINFSVMNTLFKAVADTGEPMEASLHPECFDTSDRWDREMDNLRLAETRKSIKPLYPKFNGYSYRIALMLHIINRAIDSTQPEQVPLSTFTAAIEFTRWLVSQSVSIYEELLGDEQEDTIAKFLNSTKYTGWMSVRQFHKPNWRKFKTADDARKAIEKMIELGYVEGNGEKLSNKKFKFKYVDTEKRGQVDKTAVTLASQPFKPSTANVDGVDSKPRTDDTSTVSADKKSVDKFEGDRISNGGQNLDPLDLQQVDTFLSTHDLEPSNNDTSMVSADENHNCPQAYTATVYGSKPFLESDSAVLSTCPQDLNVHKYKSPFKIGDRAKLGDDIFIVDKIDGDFIGGHTIDGSYIGGNADSVHSVSSSDELPVIPLPTPNGKIDRVPIGNGMVEIVRQEQLETIAAGEIEYEC